MNATAKRGKRTASKTDQIIGERIRLRRLEIGMSQEQLAALLGITFQQVQKYEKGVNRVSASRLLDVADVLETPVTKFYDNLSKRDGASSKLLETTSYANELSTVLVNLSDAGRDLLLDTARTFARHEALKRRK